MRQKWFSQMGKTAFILLLSMSLLISRSTSYAEENTETTPTSEPALICPTDTVRVPLNKRISIAGQFPASDFRLYKMNNTKVAKVTRYGLIIPLAKGKGTISVSDVRGEEIVIEDTLPKGGNSSYLFTPARGSKLGFAYGTAIVVTQGMNLDGGASSGLYAKEKLLTKPGRLVSNALLFGTNLSFQP